MEIQFHERELQEIRTFLQEQKSNGNIFIAFVDDDLPLHSYDLNCFSNAYDVREFCYENATDTDHFVIAGADHLLSVLDLQIHDLNQFLHLKTNVMNQENFDTLKERVKNTGFPESLENELKEKMAGQEPRFQILYPQKIGKDEVDTTLNFRKSDQNENYYFNNYEMAVKQENSNTAGVKQTFYVGRDNNYSVDEAYNLLNHRFVNKDLVNATGENYNAWVKLDFKDTDQNGNYKMKYFGEKYGFNLDKALEKYPTIKDLANDADKAKLVDSLKKGNIAVVTLDQNGEEKKGLVVANAYSRSVTVTDENANRIRMGKSEGQSEEQGKKENQKENINEDATQKNTRRRGQHV